MNSQKVAKIVLFSWFPPVIILHSLVNETEINSLPGKEFETLVTTVLSKPGNCTPVYVCVSSSV